MRQIYDVTTSIHREVTAYMILMENTFITLLTLQPSDLVNEYPRAVVQPPAN